jgi:hypothetical protein|nr:MAG TPA: hypothetical protein [Caudoviricetes sp.]
MNVIKNRDLEKEEKSLKKVFMELVFNSIVKVTALILPLK